jgi:hypothetical protein
MIEAFLFVLSSLLTVTVLGLVVVWLYDLAERWWS